MSKSEINVAELGMLCTYLEPIDRPAKADNCVEVADTAVKTENGIYNFRCPMHRGLVAGQVTGMVVTHVPLPRA